MLKLLHKLQQLKQQLHNLQNLYLLQLEEGESSNDVADKLEKAGLVKSAKEFIDYLTTNNIADKIWTGTFEIKPGSSNEEIARAIGALQ